MKSSEEIDFLYWHPTCQNFYYLIGSLSERNEENGKFFTKLSQKNIIELCNVKDYYDVSFCMCFSFFASQCFASMNSIIHLNIIQKGFSVKYTTCPVLQEIKLLINKQELIFIITKQTLKDQQN